MTYKIPFEAIQNKDVDLLYYLPLIIRAGQERKLEPIDEINLRSGLKHCSKRTLLRHKNKLVETNLLTPEGELPLNNDYVTLERSTIFYLLNNFTELEIRVYLILCCFYLTKGPIVKFPSSQIADFMNYQPGNSTIISDIRKAITKILDNKLISCTHKQNYYYLDGVYNTDLTVAVT